MKKNKQQNQRKALLRLIDAIKKELNNPVSNLPRLQRLVKDVEILEKKLEK